MAVTINTSPTDYSLSGNPFVFVFSSNQTGQANFYFLVELYADGTLKESHKVFVETGIYSHFDCSDFAERYCSVPDISDSAIYDTANYVEIRIDITEYYGTPATAQASNTNSIYAIKGKQKKSDFLTFDPNDYTFSPDKLWLTTFPRTEKIYIKLDEINKYTYITNTETLRHFVQLFQANGTPIASASTSNIARDEVTTVNITNADLLATYGFSQANINLADYIEIWWYDGVNESEHLQLWIDNRCESTSAKQVLFLSKIGAIESYRFINRSQENARVRGTEFQGQFGYLDDGGTYDYQLGGLTDFVKTAERGYTMTSDWMNEDEYLWLVENLIESPLVYINEGGTLIKAKVGTSQWKQLTNENEMTLNLQVEFKFDNDTSTVV